MGLVSGGFSQRLRTRLIRIPQKHQQQLLGPLLRDPALSNPTQPLRCQLLTGQHPLFRGPSWFQGDTWAPRGPALPGGACSADVWAPALWGPSEHLRDHHQMQAGPTPQRCKSQFRAGAVLRCWGPSTAWKPLPGEQHPLCGSLSPVDPSSLLLVPSALRTEASYGFCITLELLFWLSFFPLTTCIINQQTDHAREALVSDSRMGHYEGHFLEQWLEDLQEPLKQQTQQRDLLESHRTILQLPGFGVQSWRHAGTYRSTSGPKSILVLRKNYLHHLKTLLLCCK